MKRTHRRPPRALAAAYRYIGAHCREPLSVSELAHAAGYNTAHFIELFRRHFGTTPKHYITVQRLGRAKLLLSLSDMSTSRVAELSGYGDEFYFYRAFRRRYGETPSAYRKRLKGERLLLQSEEK